jgi:hypothetical protein
VAVAESSRHISGNGVGPPEGVSEALFNRVQMVAEVPHENGASAHDVEDGTGPQRDLAALSDEPPRGLVDAGREICDPELIRVIAAWLGRALRRLSPAIVIAGVVRLYTAVHEVRAGAEVSQGQRAIGKELEFSAATEEAVREIEENAYADEQKAERLSYRAVADADAEKERASKELAEARAEERQRQDDYDRARRDDYERAAREKGEESATRATADDRASRPSVFALLPGLLRYAKYGLPGEVLVFTLILMLPIAQALDTSWQLGALLAAGISTTVLGASALAGVVVAAIGLPVWVVGVAFVGVYLLIMGEFVPGLTALRLFDEAGAETLTAATLAACLVAVITGYAVAIWHVHHAPGDAGEEEPDPALVASLVVVAREARDRATARVSDAEVWVAKAERARAAIYNEIEELLDSAARGPARVHARRGQGVEAEARIATIRSTTATAVRQERAAARWTIEGALLSYGEAITQEPVKEDGTPMAPVSPTPCGDSPERPERRTGLLAAALTVVAAGSFGYLGAGPVAPAIGAGMAALLLLVGLRPPLRGWRKPRHGADAEPAREPGPAPIGSPGSLDSEAYKRQPDRTVPKYRDGGAGHGERQQ